MPDTAAIDLLAWSDVTRRLDYEALFRELAEGAAARDVERRLAISEAAALKIRGFGAVRLQQWEGGQGVSLPELFDLVRDLAAADSNLAHVFRNHFFAVEQHAGTPDEPFSRRVLALAGEGKTFGVVFNEVTGEPAGSLGQLPATRLEPVAGESGWQVSGSKIYSTGNLYADYLFSSAVEPEQGKVRQFFVVASAPGVRLDDDWDGFGQKLTGSGTTVFERVRVPDADLFDVPARVDDGRPKLYAFTFHQVYLTTVIAGIVSRILADAIALVRARHRNYYHGLAQRPADEPELQAAVGRIAAYRSAVHAVTLRAVHALEAAWQGAGTREAHELSLAATLAASEAKVVTDEVSATLAGLLIDVSSGSGVSTRTALDRHWRNIKVIASHNPRLYKERVLGDHYLNGTLPPTGAFF
ncbi:acyl-CoA dehydrogenase family protein [Cupriavidus consociatus]|uniref:acyl-CoA dehydrogenase family protein n=1 Tax=Cupriavidus consociatus TaxID=2821357 RepID=UPI001AE4DC3A|nr:MULTISPECIES: acyl-CoA dehydrogenase family protein [unclassified Cupriavidus]MBP0624390.1 acyl-CoA dehydrogenase [Cupriavidus sp. LEh25]MDK2661103.1 acyl-CoA dehydrogenase family protein [Cupriavidus sp. LEh21]